MPTHHEANNHSKPKPVASANSAVINGEIRHNPLVTSVSLSKELIHRRSQISNDDLMWQTMKIRTHSPGSFSELCVFHWKTCISNVSFGSDQTYLLLSNLNDNAILSDFVTLLWFFAMSFLGEMTLFRFQSFQFLEPWLQKNVMQRKMLKMILTVIRNNCWPLQSFYLLISLIDRSNLN